MSSTAKIALCLISAALAATAHMMSMSTGEIRVEGARARYEFRVPLYEVAHVTDPERTLLNAALGGQVPPRDGGECPNLRGHL
jgi:hypothetical protein